MGEKTWDGRVAQAYHGKSKACEHTLNIDRGIPHVKVDRGWDETNPEFLNTKMTSGPFQKHIALIE